LRLAAKNVQLEAPTSTGSPPDGMPSIEGSRPSFASD
jgi:hypothetical protein